MTTIATFPSPEEAHLFRSYLLAQEIEAFVMDENFAQLFWYYCNAIGGVRVCVDDSDAEDAYEAYQIYSEALRTGPYPVTPVRAWPMVVLISLLVGYPMIIFGRRSPRSNQDPQ
jgi:hypothetical protein